MLSANTCHTDTDDRLSPRERVQLRGFATIWHGWLCPTFIPVVISDIFVSFAIDPLANQNLGFAAGRIWGEYLWFRGSPASPWQWQSNFRPLVFFLWFLRRACVLGCFFLGGGQATVTSHPTPTARQGVPQCLGDTRHSRLEAQVREKNDANSLEQAHRKSGMNLM